MIGGTYPFTNILELKRAMWRI